MKTEYLPKHIIIMRALARLKKTQRRFLLQAGMAVAAVFSLSGCLLTTPFWNQVIDGHTSQVPLQAWTTSTSNPVIFECAKAYHGGLYPYSGSASWNHVATVPPTTPGSLDAFSISIYSASHLGTLPSSCWRQDPANGVWYAAVRAKQGSTTYSTFDKPGLECLGRENGKDARWLGWIGQGCTKTYSGSSTNIPYVIFYSHT